MKRIIFVLNICCLCFFNIGVSQYSKVSEGKKIMIAAHPLAAKAGLEVYNKGGNVVDAAVAVAYSLGVVEPYGSGIGGEGMMLIYNAKEDKYTIIDFKAISPAGANYKNLDYNNIPSWSKTIRGASIPGAVAGLELAREKFGKLDRKTVLEPAIRYAIDGFEVDSSLALNLEASRKNLLKDDYSKKIFFAEGKTPLKGAVIKNSDYGKTLIEIQKNGPDAFYNGKISALIVKDSEKNGGFFKKEDLLAYKPIIRKPLKGTYRGYEIITTPPPCGGMHLLEALNMLKMFDLNECKKNNNYSLHIMAEVFKLMYKDESVLNGDPEFNNIKSSYISSDNFAFGRLLNIGLSSSLDPNEIKPGYDNKNTTQLTVMDSEGNTVSLTITLSSLFGTCHTVEGAGFLLNNEMQNFNPDSTRLNNLKPNKRVVTSLIPTVIAKDGKPVYAIGTPGGDLIISTITQIIVNLIDYKMELKDAIYAPRMFSAHTQKEIEMENRFPAEDVELLKKLGHTVKLDREFRSYYGAVQSIMFDRNRNVLIGVSDPRRSGNAIGE